MPRNTAAVVVALFLSACATAPIVYPAGTPCEARSLTVIDDFSGARRGRCEVLAKNHVRISILPEDDGYINPSPWYSFRVFPSRQSSAVITLSYVGGKHRYVPKISFDGLSWSPVDESRVRVSEDGTIVDIELPLTEKPFWISAQELVTPATYDAWTRKTGDESEAQLRLLGQSLRGRPILYLETEAESNAVLFLIGRQHPPEVSGAFAFFSFVETLLGDTDLASRFRDQVAIIAIPLLNPDGVTGGHWRHNLGSKDLNRDWGEWEQPETSAVGDLLDALDAAGKRVLVFLDFHSTDRNLFYTQDDTDPTVPPDFFAAWFTRVTPRLVDYPFTHEAGPRKRPAVAKNYMYTRYGIPAATYEVGDETDRDATRDAAVVFAEELMKLMLETLAPAP